MKTADPAVFAAIEREHVREEKGLELIASENYVEPSSPRSARLSSHQQIRRRLPFGKRYYGGCEFVDQVEALAIERICKLFGAEAANVQPHSGSQANMAVYMALMNPGDTLLGMSLSHGGHLTHGSPVNFSGKLFRVVSYGLNEQTHRLDYDQIRDIAKKEKPKVLVAGASAYPRIIDFETMGKIAREVGAHLVVDMAHIAGLVAAGSIHLRFRTRLTRLRPRTKPCAALAAVIFEGRAHQSRELPSFSRASRAVRSCT